MAIQRRAQEFRVKAVDEKSGEFEGYASVFNVVDSYGDVVLPGAFAASLDSWKDKGRLPPLLWQHRHDQPLGPWLELVEDDHGLFGRGRILVDAGETEKRALAHLKAGTISGISIGFLIPPNGAEWNKATNGLNLKAVELMEASIVTFPANEEAQVDSVKSALQSPKEFERFLREAGLSRSQAKALMAKGYAAIALREAEDKSAEVEVVEALKSLSLIFQGATPSWTLPQSQESKM